MRSLITNNMMARQDHGLSESRIFIRFWNTSRYIWIFPLEYFRHPMYEKNNRQSWKAHLVLMLFVERVTGMRCCCEKDAAAYKTVLYPNHYFDPPGQDSRHRITPV